VNGNAPDIDIVTKFDPEGAKKLLAEAGYPDGFEVRFNCPNNRYVNDEEIAQNIVAMWARIGVKVQLMAENMATFSQKFQNFDSSLYMLGWGVPTYDAQYTDPEPRAHTHHRRRRQLQLHASRSAIPPSTA
jgi:peptide/nickel transport system substrate-binding protein